MPLHYQAVAHAPTSFVMQFSSEGQDLFSFAGAMYLQHTYSVSGEQDLIYLSLFSVIPLLCMHVLCVSVSAGFCS